MILLPPTHTPFPYTTLFRSSKHITLNATGGGFLTASKQFRHGATSKSRSNTASNSTKHKSSNLSETAEVPACNVPSRSPLPALAIAPEDRKSGSAGMPRPISYAVFCLKKKILIFENPALIGLGGRWGLTYIDPVLSAVHIKP